jgi:hypothetical protein
MATPAFCDDPDAPAWESCMKRHIDDAGVSLAEYMLLVLLICAAAIAGITFLGPSAARPTGSQTVVQQAPR